ncbi:MAG: EF-hand domain-containing protein [Phycisphaerales bacterium]|nr:EF-hand domain-containing protein [Phycisphaerales bacterium]
MTQPPTIRSARPSGAASPASARLLTLGLVLVTLLGTPTAAPLAAQTDRATGSTANPTLQDPGQSPPPTPLLPVSIERAYSEGRSLTLFAACDTNADDRLDLFECRSAFVDLVGSSTAGFRSIDTDADGYISWPEFDARFRTSIQRTGSLRLRPSRSVPEFVDPTVALDEDPALEFIRRIDKDGDDALSKEQLAQLIADSGQDPALAENFPTLDVDGSGKLEASEFAPLMQFISGAWANDAAGDARRRSLPPDFRNADLDRDGVIEPKEMEAALRLLHPSLARWSPLILREVDRTGDERLAGSELLAAANEARRAAGIDRE